MWFKFSNTYISLEVLMQIGILILIGAFLITSFGYSYIKNKLRKWFKKDGK